MSLTECCRYCSILTNWPGWVGALSAILAAVVRRAGRACPCRQDRHQPFQSQQCGAGPAIPSARSAAVVTVDLRTRKVLVDGAEVAVTPKEFDILVCLAADPGRVQSRQDILEAAWDTNWYGPTKVLDVHMTSLRRKLGLPGLIETVYGRGFRLSGL